MIEHSKIVSIGKMLTDAKIGYKVCTIGSDYVIMKIDHISFHQLRKKSLVKRLGKENPFIEFDME